VTIPDPLKGVMMGRSRASSYENLVLHSTSKLQGQAPIERVWPKLAEDEQRCALQSSLLLHPDGKYSEDWAVNDKAVITWSDGEVWVEMGVERIDELIGPIPAHVPVLL